MALLGNSVPSGSGVVESQAHVREVPPRLRSATLVSVHPSLLAEVQRHGKFDSICINCGGCSVVCDLTYGDVTFPRRPIHRVVIGAKDAVLEGLEPWLCHDCGDCSLACPRQADPAESMRTLRRYLTGQYDGTGLASRILSSRAWHLGSLGAVGALVFALVVVYHLYWADLSLPDFVATAMPMDHMFPMILYFTWIAYLLPVVFLMAHAHRMRRFTMGGAHPALRHFLAEAGILIVQAVTQSRMRKCPSEARGAPAGGWWLYAESAEPVPNRWLKHWLMAAGTVMMFVLTAVFLRWFQTDSAYPVLHPQRWLGYLATAFILWGTTDILVRRVRRPKEGASRNRGGLALPLLLWLTAVSGIMLHILRYVGFELATHYVYAVHLAICVSMVVVELPFGEWTHAMYRPLALYFQAVRERARKELPSEAGLEPVQP
jgi:ferredoxin